MIRVLGGISGYVSNKEYSLNVSRRGRLSHTLVFAASLSLLLATPSRAADEPSPATVRQTFQNPGKAYRPMVRWWWPGNDVTPLELRGELAAMDDAGFGGAEIQPVFLNFAKTMPAEREARIRSVGTPEFFHNVKAAAQAAMARGMWIDLTLGSGWPTGGGPQVTPELAPVGVEYRTYHVAGGTRVRLGLELPATSISATGSFVHQALGDPVQPNPAGWDERLKARSRTLAVLAFKGSVPAFAPSPFPGAQGAVATPGEIATGTTIDLTANLDKQGFLDWQAPPGDWHIIAFGRVALADHVVGNAIPGGSLILDHMNERAFDTYMRAFGEPLDSALKEGGRSGLRALFVDSLEIPTQINWSDDFLEEFSRRRGYDLRIHLPYLMQFGYIDGYNWGYSGPFYGGGPQGDAVRRDYWRTVGELIAERYYEPLNKWSAAHGMLTRVQAHGAPGDLLRIYGAASIPETEQMIANGAFDAMKMASSAANINGKRIVSSESFAAMGDPYWTTPQALLEKTDEMVVAGVNQIVYHGYPYKYDDRAYPGWSPFNTGVANGSFASFMNERNTFWPYLRAINGYIARLQYLSQAGVDVAPVAVLENRTGIDIHRPGNTALTNALVDSGYPFDFVNADALVSAHLNGGQLQLGDAAAYQAVIVQADWLRPDVAEALARASNAGVSVIFVGKLPAYGEGLANFDDQSRGVQTRVQEVLKSSQSRSVLDESLVAKALASSLKAPVTFIDSPGIPYLHKRIGSLETFFFRNPSDQPFNGSVEISASGLPQRWDAWTGAITNIPSRIVESGIRSIALSVPPKGAVQIVFNPAAKPGLQTKALPPVSRNIALGGPWELNASGHDATGQASTAAIQLPELRDWSQLPKLRTFSGAGEYRTTLIGTSKTIKKPFSIWAKSAMWRK